MHSNAVEAYKRTLKLTSKQREVLVGKLLGDGHLETQDRGRTFRLNVEHGIAQREYVIWLHKIFLPWVLNPPKEKIQERAGKENRKIWFQTVSHPAFRFYGKQFYREKKKQVPRIIHRLLGPLALAVWFMDDGSRKSATHRALLLNTQAFDRRSLDRLRRVLQKSFGLETKLRRQREGFQIMIPASEADKFVALIEPNVLPMFRYKLGKLRNNMPKR